MSLTPFSDAAANAGAGSVAPGGAPRHVGPVILSFTIGNYSKWSIYMKASLGRAGYLGHIDGTIATAPTDAAW
jgi:hypothetical protein